ncbi:type IV pilin protein [Acinetobacter sp. YH12218]|uniref:type IV pilin protein n=1 Tax=Acinetobacter sp. YH12218 TaxID=2601152 RepID=UPI00211F3083|nr:type IV pilin protein [Acinetobacter sp. YH12218]
MIKPFKRKLKLNKCNQGFTLIELMVVVVVIAILAAIAIPSYQHFVRKGNAAQAQQEMQKLAEQLERHKSRNFSYRGFNASYLYPTPIAPKVSSFDASKQLLTLPLENSTTKYTLSIVDNMTGNPLLIASTSTGQGWAIKAVSADPKNFNYLLTSTGVRCKQTASITGYVSCSAGENW